jgi:ABC-type phosphate transport system substrate-binding protein
MSSHRLVVAYGVISALATSAPAAEFKLVAHPSVPVTSLSRAEVSSAFLKKTVRWPNGTPIVPVDQSPGSQMRLSFCREVHDKSPAMIDSYWQKQVFSGRSSPPPTRTGDIDVIAYVRNAPGAIGYVSAGADSTGLKEIRVE